MDSKTATAAAVQLCDRCLSVSPAACLSVAGSRDYDILKACQLLNVRTENVSGACPCKSSCHDGGQEVARV